MRVFDILKQDHRRLEKLCDRMERTASSFEQRELYADFREMLLNHARLEEAVVYPFILQYADLRDVVEMALEDHHLIDKLILELEETMDSEEFGALLCDLITNLREHILEEEKVLIPEVREIINQADLDQLMIRVEDAA